MLSGIGDGEELKANNIDVKIDLPAVGKTCRIMCGLVPNACLTSRLATA